MENKYYIPELEDLHAGYECEIQIGGKDGNCWKPTRLLRIHSAIGFDVRTLYLTKEQIESEGWKYSNRVYTHPENHEFITYKKGNYYVGYIEEDKVFTVFENIPYRGEEITRYYFQGKCPSINEFRKIIKLCLKP